MVHKIFYLSLLTTLSLYATCQDKIFDVDIGTCYEQEGNLNLAQAAYERALMQDSDNTQAKMKLISLYREQEMQKDAEALLSTVDEQQLTPQQRTTLATLREKRPSTVGKARAQVTLDLGYDDNININHTYFYDTTFSNNPMGTRFIRLNADLSYQYDLPNSRGWFLRSDANLYHQYNMDVDTYNSHQYDTMYGRLYAGGGYGANNFSLYVPLFYDRLNFLDRDLFKEIGIRPDFNMMFKKMFVLNANLLYSKRNYFQSTDQMRNDTILGLESGFYWVYNRHNAYAKLRYDKFSAQDANAIPLGTKVFVDKEMISLTFGGLYSIKKVMDIRGQFLFRKGDFKEIPLFFGRLKRDDTTKDILLSLERDLIPDLRAHIQLHYLDNASNYNQAIFTKKEALVGLVYTY